MKKILSILLCGGLILSGCFGSGENSNATSTEDADAPYFYEYITAEFSIEAPDTWDKITSFTSEYPDGIRVAFRDNVKDGDFLANLTVIREENEKNLTNADYAQKKLNDHAENIVSYRLISQEELTLKVAGADSKTLLNTFSGKNDTSSQILNFMQLYLTKGDRAWVLTASYAPGEDPFVIERMETMLRSFNLK